MGQGPFLRVAGGVGSTSIALSSSEPSSASGSLFECCCDLNIFLTTTCRGGGGVSCRLYLYFSLSVWNWPISTLVCARATKGALFATGLAQHDHMY